MEVKQEPEDVVKEEHNFEVEEEYFIPNEIAIKNEFNSIKQEKDDDNIRTELQPIIINAKNEHNQIIDGVDIKSNLVQINENKQTRKVMNSNVYRWCAVPQCKNTSIKTPEKIFVNVPMKKVVRNMWLNLARRDPATLSLKSVIYFCEDHFDLPNDMENYIQYLVMGRVSKVRMKSGCAPTKFECQLNRKRPYVLQKRRKTLIEETEKYLGEKCTSTKYLDHATSSKSPGAPVKRIKMKQWVLHRCILICKLCGNLFTRKLELFHHAVRHIAKKRRFCKRQSNDHSKEQNINNRFIHKFKIEPKLYIDTLQESCSRDFQNVCFKCKICLKSFTCQSSLNNHFSCHTRKKPFKCEICLKFFADKSHFVEHMRSHTGEKPFKCDDCSKAFGKLFNLFIHKRCHTGEKPFKCEICLESFTVKNSLIIHKRIHTGEKLFQCNICLKSFSQQGTLKKHKRCHTGEKPFKCEICLALFTVENSLIKHMRIHNGEKPFKCDICLKFFIDKSHLVEHMRRHTGEKPFKCDVCSKAFSKLFNLNIHKRYHTGEKPFKCEICIESFTVKNSLVRHTRIHTGEKPFKCDICLKSFRQRGTLKKHNRCHTDEKPFKCEVCSEAFTVKSRLLKHERVHIGEQSFKCEMCSRLFSLESDLNDHARFHILKKI